MSGTENREAGVQREPSELPNEDKLRVRRIVDWMDSSIQLQGPNLEMTARERFLYARFAEALIATEPCLCSKTTIVREWDGKYDEHGEPKYIQKLVDNPQGCPVHGRPK